MLGCVGMLWHGGMDSVEYGKFNWGPRDLFHVTTSFLGLHVCVCVFNTRESVCMCVSVCVVSRLVLSPYSYRI